MVGALTALVLGCGDPPAHPPSSTEPVQPEGWDRELRLQPAVDSNPDPRVFETEIVARVQELEVVPGVRTALWTYNGQLPGPSIEVSRGDRLIVHFRNELPEATTIHWHGLRLPNAMDGVPNATQPAVEPGGAFTYDFVVPDAGAFWYHPHVRSAAQVGFGLYGPLLAADPDEPPELGDEVTLLLSDVGIDDAGTLLPPDDGGFLASLFGREGNRLLVNGKLNPVLHARAGRRQRWKLINAAKSRYFQLGVSGHDFVRLGGDGGFAAHPVTSETVVITPGERADVLFTLDPDATGELPVRWIPYERGFGTAELRREETVFRIAVSDEPPVTSPPLPPLSRTIERLDATAATPVKIELTRNDRDGIGFALGINGLPDWEAPPIPAALGETQLWTVTNIVPYAHPFHIHGFFFQVLDIDGRPPDVLEWKDTADVPVNGTLRLAVRFDERPGLWMFHCHILDHADAGMMGAIDVGATGEPHHGH